MKAHIIPEAWFKQQYAIPRNEKIVHRVASEEGGPVDYVITQADMGFNGKPPRFKLYALVGIPKPGAAREVKLIMSAIDPTPLINYVFGIDSSKRAKMESEED